MKDRWKGLEAENCVRRYVFFSANEVSAITGIPLALQRAWRSRDQLPGGIGKGALFSSLDVAEILIRYQLSLNGVPPSESAEAGATAAQIILYWAILNGDGVCEVRGTPNDIHRFLKFFETDDEIAREIAGNSNLYTFLWRGDGGLLKFEYEIGNSIEEKHFISNFFLDLEVAARHLIKMADRPLMILDFEGQSRGTRIKRWTHAKDYSDRKI